MWWKATGWVNPGIAPNLTEKDLRRSAGLRPCTTPQELDQPGQVSPAHHLAPTTLCWGAWPWPWLSSVEEACFVHNMARRSQTGFEVKGGNPLTENYSVLSPEVLTTMKGRERIGECDRRPKTSSTLHQHLLAQLRQHHHRWSGQKPLRRLDDFLTCSPKFRARDPKPGPEGLPARRLYFCSRRPRCGGLYRPGELRPFEGFADAGMPFGAGLLSLWKEWPGDGGMTWDWISHPISLFGAVTRKRGNPPGELHCSSPPCPEKFWKFGRRAPRQFLIRQLISPLKPWGSNPIGRVRAHR